MTTKMGQQEMGFDMERAIELTKLGASNQEIVSILGASEEELTAARMRELDRYRSERFVRLKAKLYELALKGNAQAVMRLMREQEGGAGVGKKKGKG
jgi:hypothetical protein